MLGIGFKLAHRLSPETAVLIGAGNKNHLSALLWAFCTLHAGYMDKIILATRTNKAKALRIIPAAQYPLLFQA